MLLDEPLSGAETNPAPVATADNLAYVIYTSGSTGKPKGALITPPQRDAPVRGDRRRGISFDQNDVWTLFHSYAFDFSVWELWGALLYGGRVVIVPYWVSRSPEAFRELLVARAGDGAQPDALGVPPADPGRSGATARPSLRCAT